jgi:hypothetical protein
VWASKGCERGRGSSGRKRARVGKSKGSMGVFREEGGRGRIDRGGRGVARVLQVAMKRGSNGGGRNGSNEDPLTRG